MAILIGNVLDFDPPSPPQGLRRARTRRASGLLLHRMPCHRSTQWGPDRITLGLRSDPIWSQRTSCPIGSARSWSTCVQCAYLVGCTLAQIGSPRMEWFPRCFHVLAMSLLHSLAHFLIPHVRCASSLCFSLLPCSLLVCDLLCAGIISASLLSVSYIGRHIFMLCSLHVSAESSLSLSLSLSLSVGT